MPALPLPCCCGLAGVLALPGCAVLHSARPVTHCLPLRVTSELACVNVPLDPVVDFGAAIREAGLAGCLDPNSIQVWDVVAREHVPHALSEEFAHGDSGRVEWVVRDPSHREYELRFSTAATRPALEPPDRVPMIGTGDLLRYNAGVPRPLPLIYLTGLRDLTGSGRDCLVGCWNYARRPGEPWDGILCAPSVGDPARSEFADFVRLRVWDYLDSRDFKHLSSVYMTAEIADLDGDGLPDLVYCPRQGDQVLFYLNSGERDAGGWPRFVAAGSAARGTTEWNPCRVVRFAPGGGWHLVIGKSFLRNTSPDAWPPRFAAPVPLELGDGACFLDVDDDGTLDAVCLVDAPEDGPFAQRLAWQRNLGGDPPRFGQPEPLAGIDCRYCGSLAAVTQGPRRGILVTHDVWQRVSFLEHLRQPAAGTPGAAAAPRFRRSAEARSLGAAMSLSDQAWPCVCDWDGDGDWDLLVGGGYGWPRVVINDGTSTVPAFREPALILSDGRPIRLLRNQLMGGAVWHDMGYPYPAFVDWDGDGLPDLVLPNETNRIFWYRNVGSRTAPRFGPRQQLVCDGFPDSPEALAASVRLAGDAAMPNSPYPLEESQPFYWRTGAGFADLNGDGLMDLITLDGATRQLWLFCQYRDAEGNLRLRKDRLLRLRDGTPIDDRIVGRKAHWTESFRCVDWDGDGLTDIIYSCAGTEPAKGSIYLLRNCGTPAEPGFEPPVTLCCFGEPIKITDHGPHPAVADLDGDGRPDLLACVEWSVYAFYSHAALQMPQRPTVRVEPVRRLGHGSSAQSPG